VRKSGEKAMVKTWDTEKAENFTCKCGAVYEKTISRFPMRDNDKATCDVCGEIMDSWNSTAVPSYKLIRNP
jgi:hypothetical protein